jgi:cytochrome c peroxidase
MVRTLVAVSAVICTGCTRHAPVDRVGAAAVVDPLHRGAWFIDAPNDEIVFVSNTGAFTRYADCSWPSSLIVDSNGDAFAACRGAGQVRRLTGTPRTFDVGPEPLSLALDEATGTLYVGLATAYEVVALELESGNISQRLDVGDEPTALALYSGGLAVGSAHRETLAVYPRNLSATRRELPLDLPESILKSERSFNVAVSHRLGVEQLVSAGPSLIAVVSHADTGALAQPSYYTSPFSAPVRQELFAVGDRPRHLGTVNVPRVTNASYFKGWILLSSEGLDHVTTFPLNDAARPALWESPWRAPSGLIAVEDDERAFTWIESAEKRIVRVAPSFHAQRPELAAFAVAAPPSREDPELRLGRILFHSANDPQLAAQALSCDTCHRDGRADNRTWAGQNVVRQTPMLAGRDIAHTGPYGWNGAYPTLEGYIDFTIKTRLRGSGLAPNELFALARYVREGLRGVQRPPIDEDETIAHGRALFHREDVGCANCHPADAAFTDGAQHDVATLSVREAEALLATPRFRPTRLQLRLEAPAQVRLPGRRTGGMAALGNGRPPRTPLPRTPPQQPPELPPEMRRFDTPSLNQLALTAPYLHDGSAPTLESVLELTRGHMGDVRALSPRDRADLVAYLRSL